MSQPSGLPPDDLERRTRAEEAPFSREPTYRLIVDNIPALINTMTAEGEIEHVNRRVLEYFGRTFDELKQWGTGDFVHPDDLPHVLATWNHALAEGLPSEVEHRMRRADGVYRWFQVHAVPLRDDSDRIIRWYVLLTDIDERKRSELLVGGENRTLEILAQGHPLETVLENLCRTVEEIFDGSFVSIMLLNRDENRLWYAARGSLPPACTDKFNGVHVGSSNGSCAEAAYRNESVIVPDIEAEPVWARHFEVAAAVGIRACWSTPIRSSDGEVLGTFAIAFRQPGAPTSQHQCCVAEVTHLASVAITHTRNAAALRRSEAYLAEAQRLSLTGSFGFNTSMGELVWSDETYCILGYDRDLTPTLDLVLERAHPDDRSRVQAILEASPHNSTHLDFEHRLLMPDGEVKHVQVTAHAKPNATGAIELVGAVRDVTAAKLAQQSLVKALAEIEALKDQLQEENIALREEIDRTSMFEEIVGASPAIRHVLEQIAMVAPTDSTVLILGETGTGKELVARAIHRRSARSSRPFVSVNCAAIPAALIASELFGHEKGAFTGAVQRRQGRFELAEGGTLFLDEAGELPSEIQVALLRVLQEREFERVGGGRPIRADVRIVAATNRDLLAAVDEGSFRADLYYRLNVFPVEVPPLRERPEDIPLLVEYFVHRYARQAGKPIKGISRTGLGRLQAYRWPGNIRELQNIIERAVIVSTTDTLSIDERWLSTASARAVPTASTLPGVESRERDRIETALREAKGRVAGPFGAAAKLGVPPSTLESKLRSLGIDKRPFKSAV